MPDASTPLIGRVAMPQFDWMGALFGGPQYLSSYFAQKGAAQQLQTQQGYNAQDAQTLLATPQFKAAEEPGSDPFWQRWATMQGGTPTMSALGTSLLERNIAQTYGKQMQDLQNSQEINRMNLRAGLEEQVGDHAADTQLKTYQKEAQFNIGAQQAAGNALQDPANAGNQVLLNQLYKNAGLGDVPFGYGVQPLPGGGFTFKAIGGDPLAKVINEGQTIDSAGAILSDMQKQLATGVGDKGSWDSGRAMLDAHLKTLYGESGGATISKELPGYWDSVTQAAKGEGGVPAMQEKLRAYQNLLASRKRNWAVANGIGLNALPNVSGGPLGVPGVDFPNPPANPPQAPVSRYGPVLPGPGRSPSGAGPDLAAPARARWNQLLGTVATPAPTPPAGSIWNAPVRGR